MIYTWSTWCINYSFILRQQKFLVFPFCWAFLYSDASQFLLFDAFPFLKNEWIENLLLKWDVPDLTRWIWSKETRWASVHTWREFESYVWLTVAAKLLATEHFSSISAGSVSDQFQIKDRSVISPKLNWDIDSCQESWNLFYMTLKIDSKTRSHLESLHNLELSVLKIFWRPFCL